MQKIARVEGVSTTEFSPAMKLIQEINTSRIEKHKIDPRDADIPKSTFTMNGIYERQPSDKHASDNEREIVIKSLMVTGALHGPVAMQLNLPTREMRNNMPLSMQQHYAIIEAVDDLSRDYFLGKLLVHDERYDVLNNYAGLEASKFDGWLKEIHQDLTGLNNANSCYWWHQTKFDGVIPNYPYAQSVHDLSIIDERAGRVLTKKNVRKYFFDELNKIPTQDQNEIGHLALSFLSSDMKHHHIAAILKSLSQINDDRIEFARLVHQLIRQDLDAGDITTILYALAKAKGNRKDIVELTCQMIDVTSNNFYVSGPGDSYGRSDFRFSSDKLKGSTDAKIFASDTAAEIAMTVDSLGNIKENMTYFIDLAKSLLPPNAEGYNIAHTANSLSLVPDDEREEFIELAKQLIEPNTVDFMIGQILFFLSDIKTDHKRYVELAKNLLTSNFDGFSSFDGFYIAQIARALSKVKEEEHSELIKMTKKLFETHTFTSASAYEIATIFDSLSQRTNEDRKKIIELVEKLINPNISANAIAHIFICLIYFKGDLEKFIELAKPLIPLNPVNFEVTEIFSPLSQIWGDLEKFIELAKQLLPRNSKGSSIAQAARSLSQVDDDDQSEFIKLAKQLAGETELNYNIISYLSYIRGDHEKFINLARKLLPSNANASSVAETANSLSYVHDSDRSQFIKQVNRLIWPNASDNEISTIINTLLNIRDDREEFVTLANQLIQADMRNNYKMTIVSALGRVRKDRQKFITLASQFIQPNMQDIESIISSLSNVNWILENFVTTVKQVISPDMGVPYVTEILSRLCYDHNNYANRIARILLFKHNGANDFVNLRQFLDTPLDQQIILGNMRAVAQGVNPYATGINVHAEGRDKRTLAAVETLVENWHPNEDEIKSEFDDFWQTVRGLNAERQAPLLRTLGVDINQAPVDRESVHDFGGLLTGEDGAITLINGGRTLKINARELIARFWHFANAYIPESNEITTDLTQERVRDTIRTAILNGLSNGLQQDTITTNHVVCDLGKMQLLVVGTIQGRLRGVDGMVVDVDDFGLNQEAKAFISANENQPIQNQVAQQAVPLVHNLNEIGQYLQPFIDDLGNIQPKTANDFFVHLFRYRENLAAGNISCFGGMPINLSSNAIVYYVRMMEPAIWEKGKMVIPAEIKPEKSLMVQLEYDVFRVDDYLANFGQQDMNQHAAARAEER